MRTSVNGVTIPCLNADRPLLRATSARPDVLVVVLDDGLLFTLCAGCKHAGKTLRHFVRDAGTLRINPGQRRLCAEPAQPPPRPHRHRLRWPPDPGPLGGRPLWAGQDVAEGGPRPAWHRF